MSVVVKTSIAPAAALPAVRKTLQTIDPDLPVGVSLAIIDANRNANAGARKGLRERYARTPRRGLIDGLRSRAPTGRHDEVA